MSGKKKDNGEKDSTERDRQGYFRKSGEKRQQLGKTGKSDVVLTAKEHPHYLIQRYTVSLQSIPWVLIK